MLTAANSSLLFSLLVVYPMWRIFARAGLRPALALLAFLPGIGLLAALLILGLQRWPAQADGRR